MGKKGLWANMHAKRARGEKMRRRNMAEVRRCCKGSIIAQG